MRNHQIQPIGDKQIYQVLGCAYHWRLARGQQDFDFDFNVWLAQKCERCLYQKISCLTYWNWCLWVCSTFHESFCFSVVGDFLLLLVPPIGTFIFFFFLSLRGRGLTEYFSSSVSLLLSDLCTLCKACLNLSDALCNIKCIFTSTFHQITKKSEKSYLTLSCVLSTSHRSN